MKQEWTEADRERVRAEQDEHAARRAALIEAHGEPKQLDIADAMRLAQATLDARELHQLYASLYRDEEQADAWMTSTRKHRGHPTLARVTLPDGQVIGIYDLRPEMVRQAKEARG